MKFTKTDLPDGNILFTLELTPEDVKSKFSHVTQMILRNGLEDKRASAMLLGLEAMVREIEEAQGVYHPSVEHP